MLKRIKRITSYAGYSRFLACLPETPLGYIPRQSDIPSPYRYSPSHVVWMLEDTPVITVETAHKRYDVFTVPAGMVKPTEAEACGWES